MDAQRNVPGRQAEAERSAQLSRGAREMIATIIVATIVGIVVLLIAFFGIIIYGGRNVD